LLFAYANYYVWTNVNQAGYFVSSWSPLQFTIDTNAPTPFQPTTIPNMPFYISCIAIALNLYFIIKLGRSKVTKPNTGDKETWPLQKI
jgi:hypothetical protein